jgi:hypothetical protein
MKQITAFVLIAFFFLSSTCKKEMQLPDPELRNIFGKWEWIRSCGGFAGGCITPASQGYTLRIEFNPSGIYKKFKNNSLTEQKTFSFSQETSIHNHLPVWVVTFSGGAQPMAVSFSGQDSLTFDENAYDGYGHEYVRIK